LRHRLELAAGGTVAEAQRRHLVDRGGKDFLFRERDCGRDTKGRRVANVPLECGQRLLFDANAMKALLEGECASLYSQVSERYNDSEGWRRAVVELEF
jgi:hypothetical protein